MKKTYASSTVSSFQKNAVTFLICTICANKYKGPVNIREKVVRLTEAVNVYLYYCFILKYKGS